MVNWKCDCNPSHLETRFSFELSGADLSENALLKYSLVYPSNGSTPGWRCADLCLRSHPENGFDNQCPHRDLCDDLGDSVQGSGDLNYQCTDTDRAISTHSVCGPLITVDSVAALDISPRDRLTLALLLSHLYLRLIGGPWWSYKQFENSVYFQKQSPSHKWTVTLPYLSAPKQSPYGKAPGVARLLNKNMPSLPTLGKMLFEIFTGRATDWSQLPDAIEAYEGEYHASEITGVVRALLSGPDGVFNEEHRIRDNERMRMEFESRIIKELQGIGEKAFKVDLDEVLKQIVSDATIPQTTTFVDKASESVRLNAEDESRDLEAFCLHDDGQEESVNSKESVYLARAVDSR